MPFDLSEVILIVQIAGQLVQIGKSTIDALRGAGILTDEQLAAITADYDRRIAQAEAEAQKPPVPEG